MQAGDAETVERGQSTTSLQTIGWRVSSGWTTLQLGISMVESIESSFYSRFDSPQDHKVYTWTPASITTTTKTIAPDGSGMFTRLTTWTDATSYHRDRLITEYWGGRSDISTSASGHSGFAVRTFADGTQQLAQQNSEWSSTSDEVSVSWGNFPGTSQDFYVHPHNTAENSGSTSLEGTTLTTKTAGHWEQEWAWRQGSRSGSGSVSDSNEETFTGEVYFNGWSDNTEWETGWEFTSLALDAVVNESAGWFADALNLDALTSISIPDIDWDGDVIISSGNWATDFLANQIRNAVGDEYLGSPVSSATNDFNLWQSLQNVYWAAVDGLAEQIREMVGDEFLVNASNTELYGLAVGASVVGGLGGWAAGAGATALGMGGLGVSITAGAGAGAAEYLGWTLGAQALAGGNAPGPNMGGLIEFTAAGAIGGAIFHGLGKLGGRQFDALTSNCFVAGTPVVIGDESTVGYAHLIHSVNGVEQADESWSSLILAGTACGVGLIGHRCLTRRKREEENRRSNLFDAASMDDILDQLWFPERPGSRICRNLDSSSSDLKPHSGRFGSRESDDIELAGNYELTHLEDQAMRTDAFGVAAHRRSARRSARPQPLSNSQLAACWLVIWLTVAGFFGFRFLGASPDVLQPASAVAAAIADRTAKSEPTAHALPTMPIQNIRTGMWVIAENPELAGEFVPLLNIQPSNWRNVRLEMTKSDGNDLLITLLRPLEWLDAQSVAVGRAVYLDLAEMGAQGWAIVTAVESCPVIPPRTSPRQRLVTGTFQHSSGDILDLSIAGEEKSIGTTANHPFWSEDRQQFVEADSLYVGEQLRTSTGELTRLTAIIRRGPPEPVYNLEVEGLHTYHVGHTGVLVHNSCVDMHHGIPREIIRKAPSYIDPRSIRGTRRQPNRVPIDRRAHQDAHNGGANGGQPLYNEEFKQRLAHIEDQRPLTAQDYWDIRARMLWEYFGLP